MFESSLAMLRAPPARTFDAIHHAFTRFNATANRKDPVLAGYSATLYSSNDDLVLLKQPQHEDRLTAFVHSYLPVLFVVSQAHFVGVQARVVTCSSLVEDGKMTQHTYLRGELLASST
jgi:hypothetical protein